MKNTHLFNRPTFLFAAWLAAAAFLPDLAAGSPGTNYPLLPDLPGPDIRGDARLVIHLDQGTPLVEVEGQLYALGGRPLEVAPDDLDCVTLLFVVPYDAGVFVTEDGLWTADLDPPSTSKLLAFDLCRSSTTRSEPEELGFEIALPGQPAPTVPDIVIRPTDDDPDPDPDPDPA